MDKAENMDPLNKITATVNDRDKKIWENEAHSLCISKETEKLKSEISRLENATEEMIKEDNELEVQLDELTTSIAIQQQTLQTSKNSLLSLKSLKASLIQEANEMNNKYSRTLEMYENEYNEYRSIYENSCKSYKDLRAQEIELKKLQIQHMDLDVKISNLQRILDQFRTIQQQIFRVAVVKFAKFYILYHKNEALNKQLHELKIEEKQLVRQHLELVEAVKTKQKKKTVERYQARVEQPIKMVEQDSEPSKESKEVPVSEKLQRFLSEELQTVSLTSLDSSSQQAKRNVDNSKVRILDVKVVKPPALKPGIMKKSNAELRKKMETIIENTKKSALKSGSRQVTPQSSQETPRSNLKSEVSSSQKKTAVNQLLKQQNEETVFATPEGTPPTKQETISKFFNKKKSVTFQTQDHKFSQEEKQKQDVDKFGLQPEKLNQENIFQFSGYNEEKGSSLTPVVFQKPFTFSKEVPTKQEEKRSELNFGIFDMSTKKVTPDSADVENVSSNVSFTGPSFNAYNESDEKKLPEEITFDPFDVSFNPSFSQPPLNNAENFAQTSESNTFNFLGLQNKSNFFSMF